MAKKADKKPEKPESEEEKPKAEPKAKVDGLSCAVANPKKFQTVFEVASNLVDEVTLNVTPVGISIHAIDANRVGTLLVDMPKSFFSRYSSSLSFGWNISIKDITKILKRSKTSDVLKIIYEPADPNNLVIKIVTGKRERTFKLRRKDAEGETEDIVTALANFEAMIRKEATGVFELDVDILTDLLKDAEVISDLICIEGFADKKKLLFTADHDVGNMETWIDLSDEGISEAKLTNDCRGVYALAFLTACLDVRSVVGGFKIYMSYDRPALIESKFKPDAEKLSLSSETGRFIYILAPRVEPELDETEDDLMKEIEKENPEILGKKPPNRPKTKKPEMESPPEKPSPENVGEDTESFTEEELEEAIEESDSEPGESK